MSRKEWLIAAVLTFITILSWVIFDIAHTRSEVSIPQKLQEVLEPISPELNTEGLQSIP